MVTVNGSRSARTRPRLTPSKPCGWPSATRIRGDWIDPRAGQLTFHEYATENDFDMAAVAEIPFGILTAGVEAVVLSPVRCAFTSSPSVRQRGPSAPMP